MRLLLDTHVWLWRLLAPERLSGEAEAAIADRFLVATALEHRLTLVTADRAIQAFRTVTTLW